MQREQKYLNKKNSSKNILDKNNPAKTPHKILSKKNPNKNKHTNNLYKIIQGKKTFFANSKAFVFTFEAILTLLIFILLLYSIPQEKNASLKELIITQQANDLLKVWSQKYPPEQEMISDSKKLFNNKTSIFIDEKEITSCNGKNIISSEGIILDEFLNEKKIRITVCYE